MTKYALITAMMANDLGELLTILSDAQNSISFKEFQIWFKEAGDGMDEHLWMAYNNYGCNLLRFWNYIKTDKLRIPFLDGLTDHITSRPPL